MKPQQTDIDQKKKIKKIKFHNVKNNLELKIFKHQLTTVFLHSNKLSMTMK